MIFRQLLVLRSPHAPACSPTPPTGTNFTPRVRGGFGEPLVAGGDVYAQCHFGLGVQGCPVLTLLESTTQTLIRRASDHCPGPLLLGSPAQHEYCRDFCRLKSPLTMSSSSVASPAREAPRQRPKCTKSTRIGAPGAPLRLGTLPRRVLDPQPQRSNGCGATRDVARLFFRSPPGALMPDEC